MAYRASRDKIKNIADYSNIVNIYDHDFEGGGKLTEEEVEELQNLKAMLSDIEENLESSELHLAAEQQRLTSITSKLESINNEVEALKSNHINKKVEIEAIEEDLREKLDKMKSLKEKAEETNSAEDIKAVKDYDAVLAAAEKDFQEKDDELKVLTKQLDDITRAKDEITHMSVESNELIKKINEEVNDSKKEKDHVEKLYGSLIAKDATAKFIESSMEKEKEQKELEELKQEKEEQIAKVMEGK
jgi:chromosome segregation ATPase